MHKQGFMTILISATIGVACGDDDKKTTKGSFPVPSVSEIVDEATPGGLKSDLTLTPNTLMSLQESVATAAGMEEFIKSKIFKKGAEGTLYYRYFVDVLDGAMAETETRISATEVAEGESRCFTADPVEVIQPIGINGQTINWTSNFNCWEIQDTPSKNRGGSQKMAFGKDDTHFYLNYLTRSSTEYTGTGDGEILVLAKASVDGNVADVWNIGQSYQKLPDENQGTMKAAFSRIVANKATGEFSFLNVYEPSGGPLCSIFIRSNGSKTYIEARANPNGAACIDVAEMEAGSGKCFDATDMTGSTGCESISSYPSDFLLTAPINDANIASIKTSSSSLAGFDFDAAGVGRFGPAGE